MISITTSNSSVENTLSLPHNFLFLILLFVSGLVFSAPNDHFESISLDQGLSQSRVTAIVQDNEGYMWFGTQIGLNRFDGYEIVSHYHDPANENSLTGNSISALLIDSDHNLWVGTTHTGITKLNPKTGMFERINFQASTHNAQKMIYSMAEDSQRRLWIGTGAGIFILDLSSRIYTKAEELFPELKAYNSNTIRSLYIDQHENIWIGADAMDLSVFSTKELNIFHGKFKQKKSDDIKQYRYNAFQENSHGQMVIATNNGVWSRVQDTWLFELIPYQNENNSPSGITANALLLDNNNVLWVGAEEGVFKHVNFTLIKAKLTNSNNIQYDSIQSLHQSNDDVIWIGTAGGGVSKLNLQSRFSLFSTDPFSTYPLSSKSVWAIAEDSQKNIWIGTKNGGLNKLNYQLNSITYYKHEAENKHSLSNNTVRSILPDSDGGLWVGTDSGLNHLAKGKEHFTRYLHDQAKSNTLSSDLIRPLLQTKDGMIWVGTNGAGLNRMDPKNPGVFEKFRFQENNQYSLPSDDIYQLFEDQQSRLWIATLGGGLSYFDRKHQQFINFSNNPNDPQSISSDNVLSLAQSPNDSIWIGTTNGLNRLDDFEDGKFSRIHMDQNIIGIVVYGLLNGEGKHLWLSTNKGLSHYDPMTDSFRNFDVHDGLQSNEFNGGAYFKSKQNTLYFGGIEGMNSFELTSCRKKQLTPKTHITKFEIKADNPDSKPTGQPEAAMKYKNQNGIFIFDHSLNSLSIEFSALDFISPNKINYKYRMLGYELNWNHVSSDDRTAKYTNLNPGHYTFQVAASNHDGIWSTEPTKLGIFIQPPYWQERWFLILMILLSVFLLLSFFKLRLRTIQDRNKNLEQLVNTKSNQIIELEKQKIIQKERQRINRDLHDSMGGQLISTIIQLRQGNFDKHEIIDQIQDSLKDLKYIMDSMDKNELKLSTIIQFILDKFEKKIEHLNMTIKVQANDQDLEHSFLPERAVHIQHILQESIVNVIRHSNARNISISATVNGQVFYLVVEDDGTGINESHKPGRGLLNMKYRIKKISGHMQIKTSPQFNGTQLSFTFPLI